MKRKKTLLPSEVFKRRHEQKLSIVFKNAKFIESIKAIRAELKIPIDGFKIKNDETDFKKWFIENKENNFKNLLFVINKHADVIKTNPSDYLEWMSYMVESYAGNDIYLRDNSFILVCPTIEIYENYVKEKPFPGVFEYILFNVLLVPQSNHLAILSSYSNDYLLLAISANTTKRDLIELWPGINKEQKKMPNFEKNKKRYKPKLNEDLKVLDEVGNYMAMEEIYRDDPVLVLGTKKYSKKFKRNHEKKLLNRIKQKRHRLKKIVGTN
jgi:hypothetical protein